jgi:hypothetical protein
MAPAAASPSSDVRDRGTDAAYPSADELRARFRASLEGRRDTVAQAADSGAEASAGPPVETKTRSGRFSYAPYGS